MFTAIGGLVCGGLTHWLHSDSRIMAVVIVAFAVYVGWRAIRVWSKPYVQMTSERLVVFYQGRPRHYIELAAVGSVRHGFNRTVLVMRDGLEIPVSHLGFLSSDDARHFRQAISDKIGSARG